MFDLVINSSIPKYRIPNKDASPYALLNCWLTNVTARPRPLLGHPAVHANCECTACSEITFSYCTAVQKQLLHGTPHSLTCKV